MDSRRLSVFLAVVEHGGFTRAAGQLFVSQSALSQSVKELEAELGVALFHRLGRRVMLTPAGEALLGPARHAMRDIEVGRAAVAAVGRLETGHLDLCCLPTLVADPLAPLIGAFRQRYPGIAVALASPDDPVDLVEMLHAGVSELGLGEASEPPDGLIARALLTQDLVAVLPPVATAPPAPMTLAELASYPLVAAPRGTSSRRILDEAFAVAGLMPNFAVVTAQREAILPLVLAGAGAALMPRPLATGAARLGAVVRAVLPPVTRDVVFLHRDGPLSPAAGAFLALSVSPEQEQDPHN